MTTRDTPRYCPKAHMILGLCRGFRYRSIAEENGEPTYDARRELVHNRRKLAQARVELRREPRANVLQQVRMGLEAMRLADVIDPEVCTGLSQLCDLRLDQLEGRGARVDPLSVDPGERPYAAPAVQAHDPSPVRLAASNGPRGYRLLDRETVRVHVVGEVR